MEGKLTNTEGEFIASGPCEINRDRGEVTMWPSWELHMLERERGELTLELEDGAKLQISDKHLTFKLRGTSEQRISVYRLRIIERAAVPEHLAAGYHARPPLEIVPPAAEQEIYEDVTEPQAAPPA
jgi:hypothetical protein